LKNYLKSCRNFLCREFFSCWFCVGYGAFLLFLSFTRQSLYCSYILTDSIIAIVQSSGTCMFYFF